MSDVSPDLTRMFRLDGRRAVVVGGGSGIGQAAALALAAHGAEVIVADRDEEAMARTVAAGDAAGAGRAGGRLTAYRLDVLAPGAVEQAVTEDRKSVV